MNKFFVAISDATAENRNAISSHVKNRGFGYWHWMPDIWLLTTSSATTAESIRDDIMKVAPGVHILVMPVAMPQGTEWAMYSPKDWAEWLHQNWK